MFRKYTGSKKFKFRKYMGSKNIDTGTVRTILFLRRKNLLLLRRRRLSYRRMGGWCLLSMKSACRLRGHSSRHHSPIWHYCGSCCLLSCREFFFEQKPPIESREARRRIQMSLKCGVPRYPLSERLRSLFFSLLPL
jgi:hypothetical protein